MNDLQRQEILALAEMIAFCLSEMKARGVIIKGNLQFAMPKAEAPTLQDTEGNVIQFPRRKS